MPVGPYPGHMSCQGETDLEKGIAARQRSRYLRFARPPQEKQLIESRKKTIKERKAIAFLKESSALLLIFVLLCMMAYTKDSREAYRLNSSVKNVFTQNTNIKFDDVKSINDLWTWLDKSLIEGVFWDQWYNGDATNNTGGMLMTGNSFLIGGVYLRQHKVAMTTCQQETQFVTKRKLCRLEFKHDEAESIATNGSGMYRSDIERYSLQGKIGDYYGGGYIVELNSTRSFAKAQLNDLYNQSWISLNTRAVIVEFLIYNPATNLFCSVTFLAEIPPTGAVLTTTRVASTNMFRYVTTLDIFLWISEVLFIGVVLYRLQIVIPSIAKKKMKLWNKVDILFVITGVTYNICLICRFLIVGTLIEKFRMTFYEAFIDINEVIIFDQVLQTLLGILIFLISLRSLHLLKYQKKTAIFPRVYRKASKDIVAFGVTFLVLLLAFSSLGTALFSTTDWHFSNLWLSILTITGLFTRIYGFQAIETYSIIGSRIFVCCGLIFGSGLLTAYIVAILTKYFKTSFRRRDNLNYGPKELAFYYWSSLFHAIKPNKADNYEQDITLPPEFTMAEIEYQVEELLFKMNAISGTHGLPDKPPAYFTDSDFTYPVTEDTQSSAASDDQRVGLRIQKIEDNLLKHDQDLAILLQLDNEKEGVLSAEKERQLRMELEMQIFRQLQHDRDGSSQYTPPFSENENYSVEEKKETSLFTFPRSQKKAFLTSRKKDRLYHASMSSNQDTPSGDSSKNSPRSDSDPPIHILPDLDDSISMEEVIPIPDETRDSERSLENIPLPTKYRNICDHPQLSVRPKLRKTFSSSESSESFEMDRAKLRTLRKTKSRGKGKRAFNIGIELAELGWEKSYIESKKPPKKRSGLHKNTKECWS